MSLLQPNAQKHLHHSQNQKEKLAIYGSILNKNGEDGTENSFSQLVTSAKKPSQRMEQFEMMDPIGKDGAQNVRNPNIQMNVLIFMLNVKIVGKLKQCMVRYSMTVKLKENGA